MCCHWAPVSSPRRRKTLRARTALAAAVALLCAAGAAADPASAAVERPPRMSLKFPSPTVRLAGPGALVRVRCLGVSAPACVGTLSLRLGRAGGEAPFSIGRGEEATLVVPLARSGGAGSAARGVVAVARTMQARGDSVKTGRLLRIR